MIFISHRGNIDGIDEKMENNPDYVDNAIKKGYNVEIDVWKIENKFFLGHDFPQYEINKKYLKNSKFWCHAKNLEALYFMLENNTHCFWHEKDRYTLTSKKFIWTYPYDNFVESSKTILVLPELSNKIFDNKKIYGVCADNIYRYEKNNIL